MFKKWLLRFIAGSVLLITGLLITAPADIMLQFTSGIAGLNLQGVRGNFLSGDIQQLSYRGLRLQQLSWTITPTSLLTGKLGSDIIITDPVFTGELSVEQNLNSTVFLSEINGTQSVSDLASYWQMLKFISPQGELDWQKVSLSLDEKQFYDAEGDINWNQAALSYSNKNISLGTINIKLDTEENNLLLHISDQDSVLELQGTVRLGRDMKYQLKIDMSENLPADIKSAVQMIARPNGKGRLVLSSTGQL